MSRHSHRSFFIVLGALALAAPAAAQSHYTAFPAVLDVDQGASDRDRAQQDRERAEQDRERDQRDRERERESNAYDQGQDALDSGRWDRAVASFDRVAALKGARADAALYWKAYAQYKLGQRPDALNTIAELTKNY